MEPSRVLTSSGWTANAGQRTPTDAWNAFALTLASTGGRAWIAILASTEDALFRALPALERHPLPYHVSSVTFPGGKGYTTGVAAACISGLNHADAAMFLARFNGRDTDIWSSNLMLLDTDLSPDEVEQLRRVQELDVSRAVCQWRSLRLGECFELQTSRPDTLAALRTACGTNIQSE